MGRKRVRVASLSVGRVTACFRIGSPPFQSKPRNLDSIEAAQKTEFLSNSREDPNEFSAAGSPEDPDRQVKDHGVPAEVGNKIMVVVDSSLEAQGALEWALSHTVQGHDSITLLHVSKLSKQGSKGKGSLMAHELLYSMKNMCQLKRPGVSPSSELGHSSFSYSASRIVFKIRYKVKNVAKNTEFDVNN